MKNCQTTVLSDKIPMQFNKTMFISFTGIFISINNVDPISSQIYNTLDIKAKEINYLSEKEINVVDKIKDNLHYILYFLNYLDDRTFQQLEKPILEELCNLTSSKIISLSSSESNNSFLFLYIINLCSLTTLS